MEIGRCMSKLGPISEETVGSFREREAKTKHLSKMFFSLGDKTPKWKSACQTENCLQLCCNIFILLCGLPIVGCINSITRDTPSLPINKKGNLSVWHQKTTCTRPRRLTKLKHEINCRALTRALWVHTSSREDHSLYNTKYTEFHHPWQDCLETCTKYTGVIPYMILIANISHKFIKFHL